MAIRRNGRENPLLYLLKTIPRESEQSMRAKRIWIEQLTKQQVDNIMRSPDMRNKLSKLVERAERNCLDNFTRGRRKND